MKRIAIRAMVLAGLLILVISVLEPVSASYSSIGITELPLQGNGRESPMPGSTPEAGIDSGPLLVDRRLVEGGDFYLSEVDGFLKDHPSLLTSYGFEVNESDRMADAIMSACITLHYRINPRVILVILVLTSGTDAHTDQRDFGEWVQDIGELLWVNYVALGFQSARPQLTLPTGALVSIPQEMNSATFAVVQVLAHLAPSDTIWRKWVSREVGSFGAIYAQLFEDPLAPLKLQVSASAFLYRPWNTAQYPSVGVNSWFDHQYPLGVIGYSCPSDPPPDVDGKMTKYTGDIFNNQRLCSCTLGRCYDRHDGIDFALPTGASVYPAAPGTIVWLAPIMINHGNGYYTLYGHLNEDSSLKKGQSVTRSTHLGSVGSLNHLHFEVSKGWTPVTDPYGWCPSSPDPWAQHQNGTSSSWLWADQSQSCPGSPPETTPPTINFTSYPPLSQWYNTNQRIDWSVSDTSGVWGFSQAWDNSPSGPPPQFSGATSGWLDFAGLGQGQHTVRVRAWDNSPNHNEASAQLGWFGYDTLPPLNPTSVSPGCSAQNNIWQNTCNDLNFTWSGASDGNGIGIKDYHRYWGPSSSGALDTYTSASGFDPPPVAGPIAVYYLRMATRDTLNQESLPSSLFVLRYDASPPTVTLQINNGAATTNQTNILLNLSAGDVGSGVSDVRISNNNLDWSPRQSYADTIAWTLPALDRQSLTVYVQVRDRAGNESVVTSDAITLDLYPLAPHSANYRICQDVVDAGGSMGLASTGYRLTSAIGQPWATGATANTSAGFAGRAGFLADVTGCLPISYSVTSNFTVTQWVVASGGNLHGSASYRLSDTAGQPAASGATAFTSANYSLSSGFWAQITGTVPPTTTLPPVPPTLTPTVPPPPPPSPTPQPAGFGVSIQDGAPYTNDPLVTVRVWAPNVTHVRLSNDSGYSDDDWRTYQVTTTWVLSTHESYVTPRTVYAWFHDAQNSVYGPYSDDIIYDPIPPEGLVSILGGETSTVTLWLEAWDNNSGVGQMRVAGSPGAISGASFRPYTNTLEWVLTGNVVYAQFQDRAANLSSIYGSDGSAWETVRRVHLPLVVRNR